MFGIKKRIKLFVLRNKWMKEHPDSIPMNCFSPSLVSVGKNSYGEINVVSFNTRSKLIIGNYVSIAQNVSFLLDVEHNMDTISTYPFRNKILNLENEATGKGDIVIKDDVWIGYGATVLSGVCIGQGAVIASGAVVVSDVEPYSVVGGVPAKTIKYRFSPEVIEYMLTLDYSSLSEEMIEDHIEELYECVDDNLEMISDKYRWFPKRGL